MKLFLLLFTMVYLAACSTNRAVYKSADFTQRATTHKTVAILPVYIVQTGHMPKNTTAQEVKAANDKWSMAFQESLYGYVLRQTGRNKKGPKISFQALQKTNALLKDHGVMLDDIASTDPQVLADKLGVDAVLITTLEKNKNFSDGVAYGLAAGRTILDVLGKGSTGSSMSFNAANINMNCYLYDGDDSKLLWKTYRKGGTELPNNVDDLVQYYSNWIAKKLPYRS